MMRRWGSVATDVAHSVVYVSVCQCVWVEHTGELCQMAELNEMAFGGLTHDGPRNHFPFPSKRQQHLSCDDCLESRRENNQNCCVLCCVMYDICAQQYAHT